MKAAVLKNYGTLPEYQEFPEPKPKNYDELLVTPIASSVKRLDVIRAAGKHYTKFSELPAVMGMDGVAKLDNNSRVYAMGITGMMAEKALIDQRTMTVLPDGLDAGLAAALPNALIGSDLALLERGKIKTGDVVFFNGATGLTGSLAVQMAKLRGAKRVIVTGRDPIKLQHLKDLGAYLTITTNQPDNSFVKELINAYNQSPFNLILDYLWGHPAELIIEALRRIRFLNSLKYISIGSLAGEGISVPSQLLRSKDLELIGSGIGSLDPNAVQVYMQKHLTEIFDYANQGKLSMELKSFPLDKISSAWISAPAVITI